MKLSNATICDYNNILKEELLVAMGCTEPIAIAYAASILRRTLGDMPDKILAQLSGNIIKNVKSVIVPATGGLHGIEAAVAAGSVANAPEKVLEVLSVLTEDDQTAIKDYLESNAVHVEELDSVHRRGGQKGLSFQQSKARKDLHSCL